MDPLPLALVGYIARHGGSHPNASKVFSLSSVLVVFLDGFDKQFKYIGDS